MYYLLQIKVKNTPKLVIEKTINFHHDKIHKDYVAAIEAANLYAQTSGQPNHAVKFWSSSNKMVNQLKAKKICFERDHSIHRTYRPDDFIFCPSCQNALDPQHFQGETCPICNRELRPKWVVKKLEEYDQTIQNVFEKTKEEYWLIRTA